MYRLLVVDDEKVERTGLCGLVRRFGYPFEILQAANGKQAVQLLQREPVDVLLTDIRMPLMDGLELAAWVRGHKPYVHVAIASAYGDFAYAKQAIALQVQDYLLKPVELDQFQAMMEHMLALCEKDAENKVKAQELAEYHKMKREQLLWDLCFHQPGGAMPEEVRAYYAQTFAARAVTPVLAETHGDYFGVHGEAFTAWAGKAFPEKTEAFVAEENQLVLLVHPARGASDAVLEQAALAVCEKARRLHGREVFFTVGCAAHSAEDLAASVAQAVERGQYRFFLSQGTVIFSKEGYLAGSDVEGVLSSLTQSLMEDVHYAEFGQAAQRLELLFKTLEQERATSTLYIKNLFAEILRKAARKTRPPLTAEELEALLRRVMASASLYELKDFLIGELQGFARRSGAEERQGTAHRAVAKAIAVIREQYASPALSIEYLAQKTYLSPSYFSAVFKAETGESATHFLARYRLERAKELLEGTNTKIADISAQVGFSSASYFVTVFRGAYGMSPSQYREQHA